MGQMLRSAFKNVEYMAVYKEYIRDRKVETDYSLLDQKHDNDIVLST